MIHGRRQLERGTSGSIGQGAANMTHRWRRVAAIICAALGATASWGQARTAGQDFADTVMVNPQIFSAGDDPYPAHPVAFPGGVTGLPDLTYQILPRFRPTKLDLYLPPASARGPRPVIVFIHGGGWAGGGNRLSGAFANWPTVLAGMARRGYVVAAVSYRFSAEAPFPAAIQDVKAAIRWLRTNAARYRIDTDRFATFGGSAGGQLAALAATSCGVAVLEPPAPPAGRGNANVEHQTAGVSPAAVVSDCVQASVAWYGIFDFRTMPKRPTERAYLGCSDTACTDEQWRAASAQNYLGAGTPPMLLIAGAEDRTVPPRQTTDFYAATQALRLPTQMMIIPGVDHSFIGASADATRAASRAAPARTVDLHEATNGDARGRRAYRQALTG